MGLVNLKSGISCERALPVDIPVDANGTEWLDLFWIRLVGCDAAPRPEDPEGDTSILR